MKFYSKPDLPFNPLDNRLGTADNWPIQATPTAVKMLLRRTFISSFEDDFSRDGVDMVARAIMSIYSASRNNTAEAVDRVYRLLDTSLNGASWSVNDGVPQDVPIVPLSSGYEDSARGFLQRILEQLQQGGQGELDDDILAQLVQIAALLA